MSGKTIVISTNPHAASKVERWIGARQGGLLNSKPRKDPGTRRCRAAFPMLATFGVIWVVYLSILATVLATDPYDIYRWGAKLQLNMNDVPRDNVVRWIDVITKKSAINTFLVGGSTTAMYSPDDIAAALGGETIAYNLSYGGPRPLDRDIVLDQLAINSQGQRIIITFDWSYILDPGTMRHGFPEFLYDEEFADDIRMVDLKAMRRTLKILTGQTRYDSQDGGRYAKFVEKQYRDFQKPSRMEEFRALIEEYRSVIDAPSGRTCASFNAVDEQLVPRVRKFAEKGIKIDVVMPILSYAYYYFHMSDIGPTMLDEVLISRRCFVEAVDGMPNVRVFAFDDEPAIAGDLGNFRDPGHVYNPDVLSRTLTSLSTGDNSLTRASVGNYERRIRTEVKNYKVKNSYLEPVARK